MEYPKTDEGFYELMKKKRAEIADLKISENEKGKLYSSIDETVRRYEENKRTKESTEKSAKELSQGLARIADSVGGIVSGACEIAGMLPEIERNMRSLAVYKISKENPWMGN